MKTCPYKSWIFQGTAQGNNTMDYNKMYTMLHELRGDSFVSTNTFDLKLDTFPGKKLLQNAAQFKMFSKITF